MKFTIVIATALTEAALNYLDSVPDVDIRIIASEKAQVIRALPEADALITRDEFAIDAEVIDAGKRLKVIGRAGAGLTGINVEAATAVG